MASNEKRTLEIRATLQDFVTKNLGVIQRGIARFATLAGNAFRGLLRWVSPTSLAITGLASAWAAFKGGKTVTEILAGVDALNKLGDVVGTDVDRMNLLKGAFELGGGSAEEFEGLIKQLSKAVSGVLDKDSKKLTEAFERVGISVGDLKRLDALAVFEQIAAGVEKLGTAQERAGALAQIFPKQFAPLFAAVAGGREEFQKLIATVRLFTGKVTEEGAAAADRFGDALDLLKTAAASVGRDAFIAIAERFAPAIEKLAVFLAQNRETIARALTSLVEGLIKAATAIGSAIAKVVAFLIENFADLLETLSKLPLIGDLIRKSFDITPLSGFAKELKAEARGIAEELIKAQAQIEQISLMPSELDPTGQRRQALEKQMRDLKDRLAEIANEFDVETGGAAGDLQQGALDAASLRQFSAMLDQLSDLRNLPGLPADMAPAIRAIFGSGGVEGAKSETQDFFDGFSDGIRRTIDDWTNWGAAGRDAAKILDTGLDALTDEIAAGIARTKSWSQVWKDLARTVLNELSRIIVKLALVRFLSSVFGGGGGGDVATTAQAKGGIVEGRMGQPVRARVFARGGIATGPTLALFGEGRQAEAFVPLPDNRRIPVHLNGAGGGPQITINVSAVDAASVDRMLVQRRSTILGLWAHDLQNVVGSRQLVQRTARA